MLSEGGSTVSEMSRPARLSHLRALLEEQRFSSQQELADALEEHEVRVSQSTLSKDLLALGAVKRRAADGALVYALAVEGDFRAAALEKLARLSSELLQSLQFSGNQIVLKTPPGAAQYYGASLDAARLTGVMGTIAGDDTVLVIATDDDTAGDVVTELTNMTRTGRPTRSDSD